MFSRGGPSPRAARGSFLVAGAPRPAPPLACGAPSPRAARGSFLVAGAPRPAPPLACGAPSPRAARGSLFSHFGRRECRCVVSEQLALDVGLQFVGVSSKRVDGSNPLERAQRVVKASRF